MQDEFPNSSETPFVTSPSYIARYFFHNCPRFFRYSSTPSKRRDDDGVPSKEFDKSPVMQAVIDQGYEWEKKVINTYLDGKSEIPEGDGPISERRFGPEETHQLLESTEEGRFIYQPTLRVTSTFYDKYGIDREIITFNDCHPDLIAIEENAGERTFRVLDLKSGDTLKATHRIQVLLYSMILDGILEDRDIEGRVDLEEGGVWLGGAEEPSSCDLEQVRPHLIAFLQEELPEILSGPADEVPWHLQYRCEWCDYYSHCHDEMEQTEDTSQLRVLSARGKRFLREQTGIDTIDELQEFIEETEDEQIDELFEQNASLAGERPRLEKQLKAFDEDEAVFYGSSTPLLARPTSKDIYVYMTVQGEPVGDRLYMAGARVNSYSDVPDSVMGDYSWGGDKKSQMFVADTPDDVPQVRQDFIEHLYTLLARVDRYNRRLSNFKSKNSVQLIVHSRRERELFLEMLFETLEDPDLAEKAMKLLLYVQSPELVYEEEHPNTGATSNPLVVILDALGQMCALPVAVSYQLPEALDYFVDDSEFDENEKYQYPLGHGIRPDPIYRAWRDEEIAEAEQIQKYGHVYLEAVQKLYKNLRDAALDSDLLFAWPPKFEFPKYSELDDPLLSKLAFLARYESVSKCAEKREQRTDVPEVQKLLGNVVELEALDGNRFRITSDTTELEESEWPDWLLVPKTEEGREALLSLSDYHYRNKMYLPSDEARAWVATPCIETDEMGLPSIVHVDYQTEFDGWTPNSGDRLLLYPDFKDWNTDKVIDFLRRLDDLETELFHEFIEEPESGAESRPLPSAVEEHAEMQLSNMGLTESKIEAYQTIRRQRVTAVWGPPGTGKTHFVAAVILGLASAYRTADRPFRVFVTALSHAAIENVLRKIEELKEDFDDAARALQVTKADKWDGDDLPESVEEFDEDLIGEYAQKESVVIGSTAYRTRNLDDDFTGFDLVVVDEASQVRVPESTFPFHFVSDQGRVVLAGDHEQLPPIVQGEYSEPEEGPVLHRSIFETVLRNEKPETNPTVSTLRENFRMNDVLTSYARELLYPGYQCVDDEIAERRLQLTGTLNSDELTDVLVNPEYPMTVGIIDGVQATKANEAEADIVADVVEELREHQLNPETDEPFKEDREFFDDGLFVVSPHHAQIRLIKHELQQRRDWDVPPFVDTVDKMQGQEADTVVVSYGVSDPEFALSEAEFIYGRNRLNVAVSRAKTKTVVLFSRPLLEASPRVLENEDAAEGLAYMQELVQKVRENGERYDFDLDGDASIEVLRSGRVIDEENA